MSSVGANNIGFASSASEREGIDTQELLEWKEAFESVIRYSGVDQAKAIIRKAGKSRLFLLCFYLQFCFQLRGV